MTFDQIPSGTEVFLDANTLIYHFTGDSTYGAACTRLVERIEQNDLQGLTSAHVLSDCAHRMMTIEAMNRFSWPVAGLAARLRRNHTEIPGLNVFQQAVEEVPRLGIRVQDVTVHMVLTAARLSRQYELLSGDALIVAVMQTAGLMHLASNDADFDRVPGVTRYAPA
jgi:predicted nucleic acid-binding protein